MNGPVLRYVTACGLLASCVALSGCINILPPISSHAKEIAEAKALTKVLRRLAPEAKELMLQERTVATQIKITLDETATADPVAFRQKLRGYVQHMIEIRNRRKQLHATIGQGIWETPMVFAVQRDAMAYLVDEVVRTENWITTAQNIQFRADSGQQKTFPELPILNKQLDGFLAQSVGEPLELQIASLQEEFRLGEEE